VCFAVPVALIVFFLQATVFVGLSGRVNQDYDREWWGRAGAWLLIAAGAWAVVAGITVFGPMLIWAAPALLNYLGGAAGIGALILGSSSSTPANAKQKAESG